MSGIILACLGIPAITLAQTGQLDANIGSSCTTTVTNPAGTWTLSLGANNGTNPAMSIAMLCNTGYSVTGDDNNAGANTGHMIAQGAGALNGTALTNALFINSPDISNQALDGAAVGIISAKPRDTDGVAESYALTFNQAVVSQDPVLTTGTYRIIFLFSVTTIPN